MKRRGNEPKDPFGRKSCQPKQKFRVLENQELLGKFHEILTSEDVMREQLGQALAEFIGSEIDHLKEVIEPITDEDLHYMVAIRYASLKASWIQANTQMAYELNLGHNAELVTQYRATILSTLLAALEPLVHPDAVRYNRNTVGAFRQRSFKRNKENRPQRRRS